MKTQFQQPINSWTLKQTMKSFSQKPTSKNFKQKKMDEPAEKWADSPSFVGRMNERWEYEGVGKLRKEERIPDVLYEIQREATVSTQEGGLL